MPVKRAALRRTGISGCALTGHRRRPISEASLLGYREVGSAILAPAGFTLLCTEGTLFAETGGLNAAIGNAQVDEIAFSGRRSPVSQTKIVFLAATFVAVTFDCETDLRMRTQELGVIRQCGPVGGAEDRLVVVEERVFDILPEELVDGWRGSLLGTALWLVLATEGDDAAAGAGEGCGGRAGADVLATCLWQPETKAKIATTASKTILFERYFVMNSSL